MCYLFVEFMFKSRDTFSTPNQKTYGVRNIDGFTFLIDTGTYTALIGTKTY